MYMLSALAGAGAGVGCGWGSFRFIGVGGAMGDFAVGCLFDVEVWTFTCAAGRAVDGAGRLQTGDVTTTGSAREVPTDELPYSLCPSDR